MSIADIATTTTPLAHSETVYADLGHLLPCHLKAVMALKDQHPGAVIVCDEFLKTCPQHIADSFMNILHDDSIRKDGYIEVGKHLPRHHHHSAVSDLHHNNICRRPRQAN